MPLEVAQSIIQKGCVNMFIMVPVPLIRRNHIIRQLRACGAFSESTAKTLREAGVFNPNAFSRMNDILVKRGVLARVDGNKYYLR